MDTSVLTDALRGVISEANNYHTDAECCGANHVFNVIIQMANSAIIAFESQAEDPPEGG